MRRLTLRQQLLVGLLAVGVSVGTVTVAASSNSPPAPQRPTITIATAAPTPQGLVKGKLGFGIAYGDTLTWKADGDLNRGLDDAVALGATWIRVDLSWNDIQPDSAAEYIWHRFDRVAEAARSHRLNVLATIAYTPAWARIAGCTAGPTCAPADPAAFTTFAAKAGARYAPMGVHTWEIWNEPNAGFWTPQPDPAAYTRLLRGAATALRRSDPLAYLVMAGLAAVNTNADLREISPLDFLTAVAKLGGNQLVDAVGFHPYNGPYLPSAKLSFTTPFERISDGDDSLVAVLAKYGTPDLPIWVTETGVSTNAPGAVTDGKSNQHTATHATEGFQAQVAADTVATLAGNQHVATMFWYSDQDSAHPLDYSDLGAFFGLRRFDGSLKPAFDALKNAIAGYDAAHKAEQ